jgi:hypothetical protein
MIQTVSPLGAAGRELEDALAGTKWLWQGREEYVVELRKDGTFAMDDWTRQGIEAEWEATGPKEVTVTVTSRKFRNLTATLIFDDALTSFTGTDLDKNRPIVKSRRVGGIDPGDLKGPIRDLTIALNGTKWLWHGRKEFVVELRKDGTFAMDDWTRQGITATWRATGPKEVTVTVTSQKFRNLTATLLFNDRLTSFTGTDLDKNRKITPSPRA